MKKAVLFLCVIILFVSVAGCGSKQSDSNNSDTTKITTTTAPKAITTIETSVKTDSVTTVTTTTVLETTAKAIIEKTTPALTTTTAPITSAIETTLPTTTTTITSIITTADVSETVSETAELTSNEITETAADTESDGSTETTNKKDYIQAAKPVIYLYPTQKTDVKVLLDFGGELTCTYPVYNDCWNVTAYPDGKLINKVDGKEYSYLFWEGNSDTDYDLSKGFVVKGSDTAVFLQEKLEYMGLTAKEYNEFIVYWLPKMQDNPYNLITFQSESYTDSAKLEISPKPDSILRVFMVYKSLEQPINIEKQELISFERKGFSVIEWGGTSIN